MEQLSKQKLWHFAFVSFPQAKQHTNALRSEHFKAALANDLTNCTTELNKKKETVVLELANVMGQEDKESLRAPIDVTWILYHPTWLTATMLQASDLLIKTTRMILSTEF